MFNDELDGLTPDSIRALFSPDYRIVAAPMDDLQWRESDTGDGSRILDGFPAVYGVTTVLYDGTYWRFEERIDSGAFDAVLSRDPLVHFNLGHDMNTAMASTHVRSGLGSLELTSAPPKGLHAYARLNPVDPDVIKLASKMDIGVMNQMSFAFRVKASGFTLTTTTDDTGKETDLRVIHEIDELFDVCVCAQGAYSTTEASLRTLLAAAGGRAIPAVPERSAPGQRSEEVAGDTNGAREAVGRRRQLAVARAKAAMAAIEYPEMEDHE